MPVFYCLMCRDIEDTILLALQSPGVYDDIARGTRSKFESNRPRAVLFEGPPGLHPVQDKTLKNSLQTHVTYCFFVMMLKGEWNVITTRQKYGLVILYFSV